MGRAGPTGREAALLRYRDAVQTHKLTHNDAGTDVAPRTREDWEGWVPATRLRGYLLKNTLGDWLERYGEAHGFQRDDARPGYDERLDFFRFVAAQGGAFEDAVAAYLAERSDLIRIGTSGLDSQDLDKAKETLAALVDGREIVHQGVLWNPANGTYGAPDFLIRSDVFERLFPDHLEPGEAERPAPELDRPWHYLVLDAKFTKLHLGKDRRNVLQHGNSTPAYKGQLFVYNAALGRLQGYTPPGAFLIGRGYEHTYTVKKKKHEMRSAVAVERLGQVPMDEGLRQKTTEAAEWIRRLRREGGDWSPLPEPSVPELEPPGKAQAPWSEAIRCIARQRREAIHAEPPGPALLPERVTAEEERWRESPPLEFFVDFETVNDLNDDFGAFPRAGGQAMIFMIGCGHVEDGALQFRCFVAERLDQAGEARIVKAWLDHMDALRRRLGVEDPRIFHWADAERSWYDSVRGRHPEEEWPDLNLFDLLKRIFRAEPVFVCGADDLGLKTVASALHARGCIETSWADSKVDGQGAMVGAWRCDAEAGRKGIRLADTGLMAEIQEYNEVDCKVMWEILSYLRRRH